MDIIAIDCGASFIKATRFINGKIFRSIRQKTPLDTDANKLEKSLSMIKAMIEELSNDVSEIAIGFSNEMHGFVLANENGVPVMPYISWQKELGNLAEIAEKLDQQQIASTGMPLKLGLPSTNLYYLKKDIPIEKYERLYFYTLGDFYIRILSDCQPAVHETNAAATGLYDLSEKKWNVSLIRSILGDMEKSIVFPEIYDGQDPIALEKDKITYYFFPALGDQQAALLGSHLTSEGELSLNFGTGAQMSVLTKDVIYSGEYQIRPYFNGYYIKTIPHIPSGRALNVYYNFVKEVVNRFVTVEDGELWNYINSQAEQNKCPNLEIDMSFFSNPITDHSRGAIGNIGEKSFQIGNLFDSVYTQMAENIETIYKILGQPFVKSILISGGVLNKNAYLRTKVLSKFKNVQTVYLAENETAEGIKEFIDLTYRGLENESI